MAKIMEMPKLSDTMKEGSVARWLKKEGEKVQVGLPIVEIETDKATMEYEAPFGGILLKILVGDAKTCALAAPIAIIGKEGEDWQAELASYLAKSKTEGAAVSGNVIKPAAVELKSTFAVQPQPQTQNINASSVGDFSRIKISPLARKIALDKGLTLSHVTGTGPHGRIVLRDVENTTAVVSAQNSVDVIKIPHTQMRKTIARRLAESVAQAPHFYLTISVKMDDLLGWRKRYMARSQEKFSVSDLLIWMIARALLKHPEINSSWKEDCIEQYKSVHLGFAVALPQGLVTPVVKNAHLLDVLSIAKNTKELIERRAQKIKPEDYQGGTFTISNLGMQGIEEFTAIINPPQAAILAIGATVSSPVLLSNNQWGVEQRMKMTLSCDHRAIDGAMGAAFLATLKDLIEDPFNLAVI